MMPNVTETTLAGFLLARIAEDEATAEDVRHQARAGRPFFTITAGGTGVRELTSPERWLAECAAKRRIVSEHDRAGCDYCPEVVEDCPTLRALAAVYADHPDYRDEWAV